MVKSLAQCTGCGAKLRFELRTEARTIRCPKCNTEIELAGINDPPPAAPAPEPPPVHVEPEVVEEPYSFSQLFSRSEQASIRYVSSASITFNYFITVAIWPLLAVGFAALGYVYLSAIRIILEVCIVLFDIAENIRKLANNT